MKSRELREDNLERKYVLVKSRYQYLPRIDKHYCDRPPSVVILVMTEELPLPCDKNNKKKKLRFIY